MDVVYVPIPLRMEVEFLIHFFFLAMKFQIIHFHVGRHEASREKM